MIQGGFYRGAVAFLLLAGTLSASKDVEGDDTKGAVDLGQMQGHAASLVQDISNILDNGKQSLTSDPFDVILRDELTSLRSKARRVLEFMKASEAKNILWKNLKTTETGSEIGSRKRLRRMNPDLQSDSSANSNNNKRTTRTKSRVTKRRKIKRKRIKKTRKVKVRRRTSKKKKVLTGESSQAVGPEQSTDSTASDNKDMKSVNLEPNPGMSSSGNASYNVTAYLEQSADSTSSSKDTVVVYVNRTTESNSSDNGTEIVNPDQIENSTVRNRKTVTFYPTVASHLTLPHPDASFSPEHHHEMKPYPHHPHSHLPHGAVEHHEDNPIDLSHDFFREMHERHIQHHGDGLEHFNGQFYDTRGIYKYMEECQDCVVSSNDSHCPLNPEVVEMTKWANKMETVLSSGCPRASSCAEPGSCCINDKFPFKRTVIMVTQMLKDVYNLFQEECSKGCKVDGNWSAWSLWTSCSVSCGNGTQMRSRHCSNPPAASCGLPCAGEGTEYKICDSGICPCVDGKWGAWQSWTPCSVTCGRGTKTRQRVCDDPAASECGKPCHGMASDFSFCSQEPVDGKWSSWSSWSSCPVTCGSGVIERTRTCSNPAPGGCGKPCDGPVIENEQCNTTPCDGDNSLESNATLV